MTVLSASDAERLNTWSVEIAHALLPTDIRWHDEGKERKFHKIGLSINRMRGCWYSFTTGTGSYSAIKLIEFLREHGTTDAAQYAAAWLASHPGVGICVAATEEQEDDPNASPSRDDAQGVLDRVIDPTGTAAEAYWRSRNIEPPFPDCIKFLEDARTGESAAVGILTARGRVVGVELTYLDPEGRKSTVSPKRRTFKLEKSPDAILNIPSPGDSTDVVICEGTPDLLTVYRWGALRCRHIGLPGIGTLAKLHFARGTKITVVAQGDAFGSPAAKALERGLDHLILGGCDVQVTVIPPSGVDANDIFMEGGVDGVRALLASAHPAGLSLEGTAQRLAQLNPLDYARVRRQEAKRFDIPVGTLDDAVGGFRANPRPQEEDWGDISDDPVEHIEIDLADTLDGIVKELGRYIVTNELGLATVALWCAHTHLVHHPIVKLRVSPRLAIQARDYGSGKTVTLECASCLVPNPATAASITASNMYRSIAEDHVTLMLDEVHLLLQSKRNPELLQLMNASHRRHSAKIRNQVPTADGGWKRVEYDVWGTMALASVGELPRDQQERSVILNLDKALGVDVPEHLEDGTSPELVTLKAKLMVWAGNLEELPRPTMPEILMRQHGRVGDNWRLLLAIADLAGGRWPELARNAALAAISAERPLSLIQRLLVSIRRAFDETFDPQAPDDRLETVTLVSNLLSDPDEEWGRVNRGTAINAYWLRNNLRGLLKPAKAQDWLSTDGGKRAHKSGYYRYQFIAAWRAHLAGIGDDTHTSTHHETSGASGTSSYTNDNKEEFINSSGAASGASGTAANPVPDEPHPAPDSKSNTSTTSTTSSDIPDVPDIPSEGSGIVGGPTRTFHFTRRNRVLPVPNAPVRDPDVDANIPTKSIASPDTPDVPDVSVEGSSVDEESGGSLPNGDDKAPPKRRQRRDYGKDIRAYAIAHPNLGVEAIAKHFGCSRVRAERILGVDCCFVRGVP